MPPVTNEPGIAWDWSGAARGALSALPGGAFTMSFSERLIETAIGAALALTFGIAVPGLVHAVGDRDRLEA